MDTKDFIIIALGATLLMKNCELKDTKCKLEKCREKHKEKLCVYRKYQRCKK